MKKSRRYRSILVMEQTTTEPNGKNGRMNLTNHLSSQFASPHYYTSLQRLLQQRLDAYQCAIVLYIHHVVARKISDPPLLSRLPVHGRVKTSGLPDRTINSVREAPWQYAAKGCAHIVLRNKSLNKVLKLRHTLMAAMYQREECENKHGITSEENISDDAIFEIITNVLFQYLLMINHVGASELRMTRTSSEYKALLQLIHKLKGVSGFRAFGFELEDYLKNGTSAAEEPVLDRIALPRIHLQQLVSLDSIDKEAGLISLKQISKNRVIRDFNRTSVPIWGTIEDDVMLGTNLSSTFMPPVTIGVEFKLKSPLSAILNEDYIMERLNYHQLQIPNNVLHTLTQCHVNWPKSLTRRDALYYLGRKSNHQNWTLRLAHELSNTQSTIHPKFSSKAMFVETDATAMWYVDGNPCGRSFLDLAVDENMTEELRQAAVSAISSYSQCLRKVIALTGFSEGQQLIAETLLEKLRTIVSRRIPPGSDIDLWMTGLQTTVALHQKAIKDYYDIENEPIVHVQYDHAILGLDLLMKLDAEEAKSESHLLPSDHAFGCSTLCGLCFTDLEQQAFEWISRYRHGRAFCDVSAILSMRIQNDSIDSVECKLIDIDLKPLDKLSAWANQFYEITKSYNSRKHNRGQMYIV